VIEYTQSEWGQVGQLPLLLLGRMGELIQVKKSSHVLHVVGVGQSPLLLLRTGEEGEL
jgi:hypothetical protein